MEEQSHPARPESRSQQRETAMRELRKWGEHENNEQETAAARPKADGYILSMIDNPKEEGEDTNKKPPRPLPGKFIFSFDKAETNQKATKPELYKDQQAIHNFALTTQLMETCDSNTNFFLTLCQQTRAQHAQTVSRSSTLAEYIHKYNTEMQWVDQSAYTVDDLIRDYNLELPKERVYVDDARLSNVPSLANLKAVLSELLQETRRRGRMERNRYQVELTRALQGLGTNATDNILDFADAAFADVLLYVKDELGKTDSKLKQLNRRIDNTMVAKEAALAREDMPATNELHNDTIEVLERLLDVILQRIQTIQLADNDPDSFARKFMEMHAPAIHKLTEVSQQIRAGNKAYFHDLKGIEGLEQMAEAKNADFEAKFREWRHQAQVEIGENSHQQELLFEELVTKFTELQKLGEQRGKLVIGYIHGVEAEERRKVNHVKFLQLCPEHRANLQLNLRLSDGQVECLAEIEEFFGKCDHQVKDNMKKFSKELETMMVSEMKEYMDTFRKHHLAAGELQFKKEQRLHALNRQIRATKLQLNTSLDTLDENVKDYRDQMKKLQDRKAIMASQMEQLTHRMEKVVQAFQPIADKLTEKGIEFLHPVIELQELNVKRQQKILDVAQRAVHMEQSAVDTLNSSLRKLTTDTQQAKETKEAKALAEQTQVAALALAARPSSASRFL